ncbi:MAG: hypothetical protein QXU98_14190 [Candidatus Parvarchaeota archaeon]
MANGNYVSASIPVPDWKILRGKPYVTVSAKGISNGLSNIPNDGADFGPDTLLGASLPNQYGPPYTQTSGIQEALNYAYSLPFFTATSMPIQIRLREGFFWVKSSIIINPNAPPYYATLGIYGSGQTVTYIFFTGVTTAFVIDYPTLGNVSFSDLSFTTDNNAPLSNFFDLTNLPNAIQLWSSNVAYQFGQNNINFFYGVTNDNGMMTNFVNAVIIGNITFNLTSYPLLFSGGLVGASGNTFTFNSINGTAVVMISTTFNGNIILEGNSNTELIGVGTSFGTVASNSNFITIPSGANSQIIHLYNCVIWWVTNTSEVYVLDTQNGATNEIILTDCFVDSNNVNSYLVTGSGTLTAISGYNNVAGLSGIGTQTIVPPSLSANPPVSGTVYQNNTRYNYRIYLPAYATTSGTAGSVAIALGSSSTPSTIGTKFINGSTSSSATEIIELVVPVGWYYEFTSTGVTFGTATVIAT